MKNIFLALMFGLTNLVGFSQAAKLDFSDKAWEAIKSEALSSDKLIFVDAYTSWCAPCKQMDKKVFSQKEVSSFFNKNFINAKIDMEKGEGPILARDFKITAYPTLLFVNGKGEAVHRGLGFHDIDQILDLAKTALSGGGTLFSMDKEFANGNRDPEFMMDYINKSYELQNGSHLRIAEAFLDSEPDLSEDEILDFIYTFTTDTDTKLFDYLVDNKPSFYDRFGKENVESKISDLIYLESNLDMEPEELTKLDALFKKANRKTAKKESANFRMAYFRQRGEREKFGTAAIKYVKNNKTARAPELNDLAWTFFQVIEDPKMLKSAIKWSKKSIKLSPAGYSFETLASLYEKVGKTDKAIVALKEGIEWSKEKNEDSRTLEELLQQLSPQSANI